jgi:LmbE family N-acetylglucosaminyl deacetylase
MAKHSRRHFLGTALPVTAATTLGFTHASTFKTDPEHTPGKKLKIIVAGAHPDDPETMCGGTMALLSAMGQEVVAAYLTRGEAGIEGKSFEESAKIRTAEALNACKILNVRPEFIGQIDGNCEITRERYSQTIEFFKKEDPDIIITHWPVDSHRDHRICSILVYDAWLSMGSKAALYYGEVMSGVQSQNFAPTVYIDISGVIQQKHEACFAHESQQIKETYPEHHGKMESFRGMESGHNFAEAFVGHSKNKSQSITEIILYREAHIGSL